VFGAAYGLEHALWFAPSKEQAVEEITFKRSNAHDIVAQECRAVREGVGLMEISTYAKYEVTGADAETWLSRVLANRMPQQGRIALTPMLNHEGKLIGDFTVAKLASDRFFIIGSGIAENYHMRWWERHMPDRGVAIHAFGAELVGLSVAGPKSRDVLQKLVKDDLSTAAFPFLSFRKMDIGLVPALVGRISFTGDLGYEIWVKPEYQRALYDALLEAGKDFGIRHFGARALTSLRLEKSFGTWAREYRPIYGPYEAGLDRFIDLRKNDFIGREAAAKEKQNGGARKLVTLAVDATDADTIGDEPVWHDGKVVGWITSGGYAHYSKTSIAMGYVPAGVNGSGKFEVEILGERRPAKLCAKPVFDPDGIRMRT
jgi:dimethylglycine dehydrogenase